MYEYLKGELVAIQPTYIVVENHGIGYQIMFANPYRIQSKLNEVIRVELQQIVREDSITLYGFLSDEEKELFQNDDVNGFIQAVESGNITYLTKFPGVGKKTAQQIVLDLKGKFTNIVVEEVATPEVETTTGVKQLEEAREALLGLGYSAKEITKVWKELEAAAPQTTQEALSIAFKLLMK